MDRRGIDLPSEVADAIERYENFLLKGGAGSGKTYSLVEVITFILKNNKSAKIACITYTNAAADELNKRFSQGNQNIASTIHKFIWGQIARYQSDIKHALIESINDGKITNYDNIPLNENSFQEGISYGEFLNLQKGVISHDEVLIIASRMFQSHKLLRRITKLKYDYIFIDEYQDTHQSVLDILFDYVQIADTSHHQLTIGLFGDEMQKIYNNMDGLKPNWKITEIIKKDNYRSCPRILNDFCNKIRTDGVKQRSAGVMKDYKGDNVKFFYSTKRSSIQKVIEEINKIEVPKPDTGHPRYRCLFLTHKLLAKHAGYENLYDLYDQPSWLIGQIKARAKDVITNDKTLIEVIKELKARGAYDTKWDFEKVKIYFPVRFDRLGYFNKQAIVNEEYRCPLLDYVIRLVEFADIYEEDNFFEIAKKYKWKIKEKQQLEKLRNIRQQLRDSIETNKTIGEIIDIGEKNQQWFEKGDRYKELSTGNPVLFNLLKNIKITEVFNVIKTMISSYSEFGTQHSSKGLAYRNIVGVVDSGNWHKGANYKNVFKQNPKGGSSDIEALQEYTRRMMYVVGSRAECNLYFFFYNEGDKSQSVIQDANSFFGEQNVINLDIEQ
jgi:hypothetical protein